MGYYKSLVSTRKQCFKKKLSALLWEALKIVIKLNGGPMSESFLSAESGRGKKIELMISILFFKSNNMWLWDWYLLFLTQRLPVITAALYDSPFITSHCLRRNQKIAAHSLGTPHAEKFTRKAQHSLLQPDLLGTK